MVRQQDGGGGAEIQAATAVLYFRLTRRVVVQPEEDTEATGEVVSKNHSFEPRNPRALSSRNINCGVWRNFQARFTDPGSSLSPLVRSGQT